MIISRTPYRISFFGGGTDYPIWYKRHGGEVLGTTIDKYCYLTCRRLPSFFEHKIRIVYSITETCKQLEEIKHPAVRETLRYIGMNEGLEIHHDGELPARSGIGSSSSFTVGLLHALYRLRGEKPDAETLARESIYLEQEKMKETVGSQDQILAAHGGFNHVIFSPDGSLEVRPMMLPESRIEELNQHLMLFFTGIRRSSSDIAETYVPTLCEREKELKTMKGFVRESIQILEQENNLTSFGELLHEAWKIKSLLSEQVTNPWIQNLYEAAREAGALGGKLTGAGGGGFLLLFVPPEKQNDVRQHLRGLLEVPFRFESSGSRIIYADTETESWSEALEVERFLSSITVEKP